MMWQRSEPKDWPQAAGVVVLEMGRGESRDGVVGRWLAESRSTERQTWHLRCATHEGGVWAGLAELIESLIPSIRERAPELLSRHSRELSLVLPAMRAELEFPASLTDTIEAPEQTRNYPADRAYRCLHGLGGSERLFPRDRPRPQLEPAGCRPGGGPLRARSWRPRPR